ANSGLYIPCLTVTDANGCVNTSCDSLVVCPITTSINSIDNLSGNYSFTSSSSGIIASYLWDFGDGNTSTLTSPSHTYLNDGNY
ncbi:MAG: PKD domain-containing protein, partial [Vicingaceae bacterium]